MRVLIVEDELLVAQQLSRFSRDILGSRLETLRIATEFSEASGYIDESAIDLLLLDLNVTGHDGTDLLKNSVADSFHTIVLSANPEDALRAFEYGVDDFVTKPFTQERLAHALARIVDRQGRASCAARFLAVRKHGRLDLVPIDRLLYVQGAGAYAELVLDDATRSLHDKTLEQVLRLLPPVFERIHKSYIVRMSAVKVLHIHEGCRYEAELNNGVRLPVGRTHYRELRQKLR